MSRLAAARESLRTGSLADAVLAAARLKGVPVTSVSSHPARPSSRVPEDLRRPVAELLGAMRTGGALVGSSLRVDPVTASRLTTEAFQALLRPGAETGATSLEHRLRASVDERRLYAGALVVARAIDDAVPTLERVAKEHFATKASASGCDVVDLTPALCIGGSGSNTYTKDEALLVDLGGDDLHANSAGGADPGLDLQKPSNNLPVSITVDLAGNDRYVTSIPSASGSQFVQGAAFVGSIGILLDQQGNDAYEATSTLPYPTSQGANGQGMAEYGAVGILCDRGGNDTYRLVNLGSGEGLSSGGAAIPQPALGQGLSGGGLAMALDSSGNDSYLVAQRPRPFVDDKGMLHPGQPTVISFGSAAEGVGISYDGGGTDSMVADGAVSPVAPDEPRPFVVPFSIVEGFGFAGLGGVGVSISGTGDTARVVTSSASAPATDGSTVSGLGNGLIGALGAVYDAGGNDRYAATADETAHRVSTATDTCGCGAPLARAESSSTFVGAGGLGDSAGVGLLWDRSGDDWYTVTATASAVAEARDRRATASPAATSAEAHAYSAGAFVQGEGAGESGTGILIDGGGNDQYVTRTSNTVSAGAEAVVNGAHPTASADAGNPGSSSAETIGMGAAEFGGAAEFLDLGGSDSYVSTNSSSATASPATERTVGLDESFVLGWVSFGGQALFADIGPGEDVFTFHPGPPPCGSGSRGSQEWARCGLGLGAGLNP